MFSATCIRLPCMQWSLCSCQSPCGYNIYSSFSDLQDPLVNRNVAQLYGFGVNESFQLSDSDYSSDALTNIIMKNVENTSFDGITVSDL